MFLGKNWKWGLEQSEIKFNLRKQRPKEERAEITIFSLVSNTAQPGSVCLHSESCQRSYNIV